MKDNIKEGYKDSALGVIPDSWEVESIDNIGIELIDGDRGSNYPKAQDFSEQGYCLFLSAKNVTKYGFKFNECQFISEERDLLLRRGKLEPFDIVITTRGSVGHIALFDSNIPYPNVRLNSGMVIIRDIKSIYDKSYLYQLMNSSIVKKQLEFITSGSAQPQLTIEGLKKIKFLIFSFEEQKKIAEILSTVDKKIDIVEQQIKETKELKKGLMQKLLVKGIGHTKYKDSTLGQIPHSWEVVKLGDVLKLGSGKDYKHLNNGNVPVYGTGGLMTMVDDYLYDGESVGIGRKGTIDKPVFLKGKFWTVDTLFYTHSFENVTPYYIYLIFQTIPWRKYNEATGVPSLSKVIIEKLYVIIPPLKEQEQISRIISTVDDKIDILEKKKSEIKDLKKGLMQQLLTGKIRVNLN